MGSRSIVDKVGLLFTVLVAKSRDMHLIMSSSLTCTYFEYYVILCSVGLLLLSYYWFFVLFCTT